MTTPHHHQQHHQQPSSPGATRAADVLAAASSGRHSSYIPYGEQQQQQAYHHHSTHQVPPPNTTTSSYYPHPAPQSQSHYTNSHALSPTLLENKPELPSPATGLLLPPPHPLNATNGTRSPSFQYQQDAYHYPQHSTMSPPPVASTSAAATMTSAAPAASKSRSTGKIDANTVNTASASTPSTSLNDISESSKKSNSDNKANNNKSTIGGSGLRKRNQTISNSSSNMSTPVDGATMNGGDTNTTVDNGSGNTSASGSSKKKPTRRYNASCDACRARKRKCPGRDLVTGKTLCTACADRGVECTYGNLGEPSRLRRADTENEKLRNIIQHALQAETADEKDDILATITERMLASSGPSHHSTGKNRRTSSEVPDDSSPRHGFPGSTANKRFKEEKDEDVNSIASTSAIGHSHLDSASHLKPTTYSSHLLNQPQFNGSSSAAHGNGREESGLNVTGVPSPRPSSDEETSAQFTQAVITNEQERGQGDSELERHVSYYLSVPFPHGDFQDAPSPADDQRLLDFYFSWLNPRYALLSRKFFEQSRHVGDGVYCTPFLLWSLYAHSASHCPGFEQHQAYYRARAHILLTKELCKSKAATLPLAQGLILLAGTAAAKSDHSLAWTLSFTVTGMVIDLLETMDQSITENERMMRKRLYWSHYVWALVLALALNRKPCVPKLKVDLPSPDHSLDTEVWTAVLPVRGVNDPPQSLSLPRPGHELECFRETCQLFSFLDEILTNVYVAAHEKRAPDAINEAVLSIQERMAAWQSTNLSPNLLLNVHDLPGLCPPPHIIHFNLLLRAFWILLYRPFYNLGSRAKCPIKSARQSCNQYASEIYAIFIYLEENFGVLQLHFSFIYSAYWAATIDVASAKRDGLNPDLLARLSNSARILLTWISLPGMRQSVSDLIEQIEALLLADVPRQLPMATEAFSAYDPMHHPPSTTGQEVMMHSGTDAYFPQIGNMIRPHEEIMFNDPMMGVSAPVAYGPLGGLYWDSAAGPLW